jgi:hypothetical protein
MNSKSQQGCTTSVTESLQSTKQNFSDETFAKAHRRRTTHLSLPRLDRQSRDGTLDVVNRQVNARTQVLKSNIPVKITACRAPVTPPPTPPRQSVRKRQAQLSESTGSARKVCPTNAHSASRHTLKRTAPSPPRPKLARNSRSSTHSFGDSWEISGPTDYKTWSTWNGTSSIPSMGGDKDVWNHPLVPKLRGQRGTGGEGTEKFGGSQTAPATVTVMPMFITSTRPMRPMNVEPILGRLEVEAGRIPVSVPIPTPTMEGSYHQCPPHRVGPVASASSTSSRNLQSLTTGTSSGGFQAGAPQRCISPLPEPSGGMGKSRANGRPLGSRSKRPVITQETFMPFVRAPILPHIQKKADHDEETTPKVQIKSSLGPIGRSDTFVKQTSRLSPLSLCPSPLRLDDEEQELESVSPPLTLSPIPSSAFYTPVSRRKTPTLTASSEKASPRSATAPEGRVLYAIPNCHTPRPATASDQVRKLPITNCKPPRWTLFPKVDSRHHPQIPAGKTFSALESYIETVRDSPISNVESTTHEVGFYTSNIHGCTLRRAGGERVDIPSPPALERRKQYLAPSHGLLERVPTDISVPQEPQRVQEAALRQAPEEDDSPEMSSNTRHQKLVQQHQMNNPQKEATAEKHFSAQRHDMLTRLGNNTHPRHVARVPTPDPRAARSKTFPRDIRNAVTQSGLLFPADSVHQIPGWDAKVEDWITVSCALAEQRSTSTQLARLNAVRKPTTSQTDVAEEWETKPQASATGSFLQSVVSSDEYVNGTTYVTEQEFQGEHTESHQRIQTLSPSDTFYTAASVIEQPGCAIQMNDLGPATKPESIVGQDIHSQAELIEPPICRSPGSNNSRESRFREHLDSDESTRHSRHVTFQHLQEDHLIRPIQGIITSVPTSYPNGHHTEHQNLQTRRNIQPQAPIRNACMLKRGLDKIKAWKNRRRQAQSYFPPRRTRWIKALEKVHLRDKPSGAFHHCQGTLA